MKLVSLRTHIGSIMRKVLFVDVEVVKSEEDDNEVNLVIVFFLISNAFFFFIFNQFLEK